MAVVRIPETDLALASRLLDQLATVRLMYPGEDVSRPGFLSIDAPLLDQLCRAVIRLTERQARAITDLEAAAAMCQARTREPDADHPADWICSNLDALDIVRAALTPEGS
jgi:hypothetical protein